MTPEQQAAYVFAQSASALIEAMGMCVEATECLRRKDFAPYNEADFKELITKYGIGHNDILSFYQQ